MKLLNLVTSCAVSLLFLSACAGTPTPKSEPIIDEKLPVVQLTENGAKADVNAIALEWKSITDPRVQGIYIYKGSLDEKNPKETAYYETIKSRFPTHYLDTHVEPDTKYTYQFKVYSKEAEGRMSEAVVVSTLPMMESVTWIHAVQDMPRSAKILWRPHPNEKVNAYKIQRRTLESKEWDDVAIVHGRLSAEYIDNNLKDKFTYIYRIRSLTYDHLTSKPSKEVKVVTKPLPKSIENITATKKLPRKIEIKWAKTNVSDFKTYRVYRSTALDGSYEMIAEVGNTTYIDNIEEDGKTYFYSVTVVDKDGLESKREEAAQGSTLKKPDAPDLVEATLIKEKVKISWSKGDERIKTYIVEKRYKKSLFDEAVEDYEDVKGLEFIDPEIQPAMTYYYKVFSVDEFGIKSEPSIEVELKTDKILDK
jgi:fibronectin type 3 domain-containing protein